jgi:hypothetical protein
MRIMSHAHERASNEEVSNFVTRLKRKKRLFFPESFYQVEHQTYRLKRAEVQEVISSLNPKKAWSYGLTIIKALKELPVTGIKYLSQLLQSVLLISSIHILKSGKPPNEVTSYWSIGLLTIVSNKFSKSSS